MDYRNKTALVTGASGGIGEQFARTLAAQGAHLILVARSEDTLVALAAELHGAYGVQADVVTADLSVPDAASTVVTEVDKRGLSVDILINNAGFGTHGDLADADPARVHAEVTLNVTTLTDLTTVFYQRMVRAGGGDIVNVASTAAFQPVPHMAVYAATKAFVLSFSEALWWEGRQHDVRVLALCPGATDTGFFDVAGDDASVGKRRSPEQVVNTALKALRQGKPSVVDGLGNYLSANASRVAPRSVVASIAERAVRPKN